MLPVGSCLVSEVLQSALVGKHAVGAFPLNNLTVKIRDTVTLPLKILGSVSFFSLERGSAIN